MKSHVSNHFGFSFRWAPDTFQALLFSMGSGADLRGVERHAALLPERLLHEIFRNLGPQLHQGNRRDFEVQVDLSGALRDRVTQQIRGQRIRIGIETTNANLDAQLREGLQRTEAVLLPDRNGDKPKDANVDLRILDRTSASHHETFGALRPRSLPQVRLMSNAAPWAWKSMGPHDHLALVETSKGSPEITSSAWETISEALDQARFSGAWEALHHSHLRWRLRKSFSFDTQANRVDVVLDYEAEERVLAARDLRLDTFWEEVPRVRLADVAGHSGAKEKARKIVSWLQDPLEEGLTGLVLEGPPGTGKSLLTMALAGEAGVAYIHMAGPQWMGSYWGETERNIRRTFEAVAQYDACVLAVEEIEGIAFDRTRASSSSPAYYATMLGTLLTCLDKASRGRTRLVFVVTTNLFGELDQAFTRRMERLHLGLPCAQERRELLAARLSAHLDDSELAEAAAMTSGLSQADLTVLSGVFVDGTERNLAAFQLQVLASRRGPVVEGRTYLQGARERIATHEAGHAVVAHRLLGDVETATILPTSDGSGGAFIGREGEGLRILGADGIKRHLAVLLAGRVAERIRFPSDGVSEGGESDLRQGTLLLMRAIGEMGLDDQFPCLAFSALPLVLQQSLGETLLTRVKAWLSEAETLCEEVLQAEGPTLDRLTKELLQKETISRDHLLKVLKP